MALLVHELIEATGYANRDSLWYPGSAVPLPTDFQRVRQHLTVPLEAIYLQNLAPMVYFASATSDDEAPLYALHRQLWNYNQGFLLVVVQQDTAHAFDCYQAPEKNPKIRSVHDPLGKAADWNAFTRDAILSGQTVLHHPTWFSSDDRMDRQLFVDLAALRDHLETSGLERSIANALVIRSLLIRYLEDRGVSLNGTQSSYIDILRQGSSVTFQFYRQLVKIFNGDVLAVLLEESSTVLDRHLESIAEWLSGTDMRSGQRRLWPYDFAFISPEVLSSVYQTLIGDSSDSARKSGIFYTPRVVVEQVLDSAWQAMDIEADRYPTILDPACGSGAFLAAAFRRIINSWIAQHPKTSVGVGHLAALLNSHIVGVDKDPDAVRLSALSCYLVMLDYLDSETIEKDFRFPRLIGQNLYALDFLSSEEMVAQRRYDLIVGNPPWKDRERHDGVPIALAFADYAMTLLSINGTMAMILPAGWLYNPSDPYKNFRKRLVARMQIYTVIDLTSLRKLMFFDATAPGVILVTRLSDSGHQEMDPTFLVAEANQLSVILPQLRLLSHQRHKVYARAPLEESALWKSLRLGSLRPWVLLDSLRHRFPQLGEISRRHAWSYGAGIVVHGGQARMQSQKPSGWPPYPYLNADAVQPLAVVPRYGHLPERANHWRTRRGPKLYQAPLILVRRGSISHNGRLSAGYTTSDYYYPKTILGIAGTLEHADLLRGLAALLNSSIVGFLLFLVSARWGVERGAIELNELVSLPCPPVSLSDQEFQQIRADIEFSTMVGRGSRWERLDHWAAEAYGLTSEEIVIITDFIKFRPFRHDDIPKPNDALNRVPGAEILEQYTNILCQTISKTIGDTGSGMALHGQVIMESGPFFVVALTFEQRDVSDPAYRITQSRALLKDRVLVDEVLREGKALRFDDDTAWIVKISRTQFWTRTVALNDADWFVSQILRGLVPMEFPISDGRGQ